MLLLFLLLSASSLVQDRTVLAVNATIERNQHGTVFVEVDARGDENTFGASLNFDPLELVFVSATLAPGAPAGSSLIVNSSQSANGRLGIAFSMPIGQAVPAGHLRLASLNFFARADSLATATGIWFGDQPLERQVVKADATAIPVSSLSFVPGNITFTRSAALVSAASFIPGQPLAPSSIASAFALHLATGEASASTLPLPTDLLGTMVRIKDVAKIERAAPLFYVGPTQVNFLIPEGSASGPATVTVVAGDGVVSTGTINVASVAPAFFTFNSSGLGVVSGEAYRYRAGLLVSREPIGMWDGTKYITHPIDLGPDTDQIFLVLYGTGFRFNTGLSAIQASLAGRAMTVGYAGAQGFFVGEDQVNLGPLPRNLSSAGISNLAVTVDGKAANVVTVEIK